MDWFGKPNPQDAGESNREPGALIYEDPGSKDQPAHRFETLSIHAVILEFVISWPAPDGQIDSGRPVYFRSPEL